LVEKIGPRGTRIANPITLFVWLYTGRVGGYWLPWIGPAHYLGSGLCNKMAKTEK
jgi:hypothetical protein